MPISEAEVLARRDVIGASDVPKIVMGKGVYDLWLEKTRRVSPQFAPTKPAQIGLALESTVMGWAEAVLGPIERDIKVKHPQITYLVSNLDGRVRDSPRPPVEIKTTKMMHRGEDADPGDQWGEEGTSQVPDRVALQCHAQMMCCGPETRLCHVVALIGGEGEERYYVVPRNEITEDSILRATDHFWVKHVRADIPPEADTPSWDYVRQMPRTVGAIMRISDPRVIEEYREASEALRLAIGRKEDLKKQLVAISNGAEYITAEGADGAVRIYKKSVRAERQPRRARVDTVVAYVKAIR